MREEERGTILTYTTGFVLSVLLTLSAYVAVVRHLFAGWQLTGALVALGILQLLVQLVFFLHLGRETRPRWKLAVFAGMLIVLFILVFGSLWIMNNLNYHMMTPQQIQQDEGIQQ